MEGAKLFNQINMLYPNKPDLRKTKEFINWKRDLHGLPGIDKRERRKPIRPVIYQPICVNNGMTQTQSMSEKVMELRIPLIRTPRTGETLLQQGTDISNDEVLDEGTSEPSFPEQGTDISNDEVLDEGTSESSFPEQGTGTNNDEVLDQGTSEPSSPEQGTGTNNDEVLDQGTNQPSAFGDIPPDTVQQIITELRADPAIATIMDDIEAFENGISNDEVLDEGTSESSFPEQGTGTNNDEVLDQGTSEPSSPEQGTGTNNDEVLDQGTNQPSAFGDIPPDTVQQIITELRADPAIATIMDDIEAFENGINNDEVLDEGTIQPAAFGDIPPDTVQQIITELRADPAIATIMDDVVTDINNGDAEQSEFDFDLGMEVEIDDRLEREFEDMVYW